LDLIKVVHRSAFHSWHSSIQKTKLDRRSVWQCSLWRNLSLHKQWLHHSTDSEYYRACSTLIYISQYKQAAFLVNLYSPTYVNTTLQFKSSNFKCFNNVLTAHSRQCYVFYIGICFRLISL